MEESTTDATVQEQAAIESQPEEQHAEAEQTPTSEPSTPEAQETSSEPSQEPAAAENSEESDIDPVEYWAKKSIDVTTPEGQAAVTKAYRESVGKMNDSNRQANELARQLAGSAPQVSDDPLVQQLANEVFQMRIDADTKDFIREKNVSKDQMVAFASYLQANPAKEQLINAGYLDVREAYELSGVGKSDPKVHEDKGAKKALENLATSARATAPSGGASSPASNHEVDPIMEVLRSKD